MTARQVRAVRGVSSSVVTALIAATAHTLAGTGAPSPLLVLAAGVLAAPIATILVGGRPSVLRTSAAVLAAQVVFHVVFALFGSDGGIVYPQGGHAMMAHAQPAMAMSSGDAAAAHGMLADPPMLAAHVLAALATVLLLHRGERMLRALARGVRRLLPKVVPAPAPRAPRALALFRPRPSSPRATFGSDVSRRGPPLAVG